MSCERVGMFGCATVGLSFLVTLVALSELLLDVEKQKGVAPRRGCATRMSEEVPLDLTVRT